MKSKDQKNTFLEAISTHTEMLSTEEESRRITLRKGDKNYGQCCMSKI